MWKCLISPLCIGSRGNKGPTWPKFIFKVSYQQGSKMSRNYRNFKEEYLPLFNMKTGNDNRNYGRTPSVITDPQVNFLFSFTKILPIFLISWISKIYRNNHLWIFPSLKMTWQLKTDSNYICVQKYFWFESRCQMDIFQNSCQNGST